MPEAIFTSFSLIDYFIVYVGHGVDCSIIYFLKTFECYEFFYGIQNNFLEIDNRSCISALKFDSSTAELGKSYFKKLVTFIFNEHQISSIN